MKKVSKYNNYDHLHKLCYSIGVGPINYYESTYSHDLRTFNQSVAALQATGGGDFPEYALYAMLQGLRFQDIYSIDLMTARSQMIVLTDATSKQEGLVNDVINDAINRNVCIHIFATDRALSDGIYRRIANETHGILHTQWDIVSFARAHNEKRCKYLEDLRKKRTAILLENPCEHFIVSRLAALLKLSIETQNGATVTLTRPHRMISTFQIVSDNFGLFTEKHPVSGHWSACTNIGGIQVNVHVTYIMDMTPVYLSNGRSSIAPPPACRLLTVNLLPNEVQTLSSPIEKGLYQNPG